MSSTNSVVIFLVFYIKIVQIGAYINLWIENSEGVD